MFVCVNDADHSVIEWVGLCLASLSQSKVGEAKASLNLQSGPPQMLLIKWSDWFQKQPHNYVFVIVHYKSAYRDFNFLTQISLLKIAIRNSEWLKTLCKGNEREIVSSRKV